MNKSDLKILIAEPELYSPKAISLLKKLGRVIYKPLSKKEFLKTLPKIDVLIIRLGIIVNKEFLDLAKNLKVVATNTTGLNHVDVEEVQKREIAVISLKGHSSFLENIHATPELTFALMLALIRKIPWAFDSVKKGEWNRMKYFGCDLFGKTLGILGLGRIGKIIAGYAKAFGMNIIACDPYVTYGAMKEKGVKKVEMNELFKNSDIISVHVLYNPETDKLVKEKHFKLMKKIALFINTSRGEIIDEAALLKALRNKLIAGAAVDVMRNEDPVGKHLKRNSLLTYAKKNINLIIVPHIGGATLEAWQATEEYLASLVLKHFENNG